MVIQTPLKPNAQNVRICTDTRFTFCVLRNSRLNNLNLGLALCNRGDTLASVFYHTFNLWIVAALVLLFTSQCSPSMPPLPATPTGPTVRIALLTPNSGELATFGRMMRNGVILAVDEWNAKGGLLGNRVEWSIYDTKCSFEAAQQATRRAIEDGIRFLIGPICSEAALAAAVTAEEAGALIISPTATHPLVTVDSRQRTRPTIFRAVYSYDLQGKAAAKFARDELNAAQAAILYQPTDQYARSLADTFMEQFASEAGQIVYEAEYPAGTTDFTAYLLASDEAGADFIYVPGDAATANQVGSRLNELGLSRGSASTAGLVLLGSDAWESDQLDRAATGGSYFPVQYHRAVVPQTWLDGYKATYAVEPTVLAALGYDSTNLLAAAIEQAGSFDPEAVAKSLEQGTFEGVTGPIVFDVQHNPLKPVIFVKVENETLNVVKTVNLAAALLP